MHLLTGWKDRILHKPGKIRDTKAQTDQDQVHPDRRSGTPDENSKSQLQPEDPVPPQGLWQCAFSQLDQKDQNILLKHNPASTKSDEDRLRVIDGINYVIDTTKKRYEEYQEGGGIRIRRSTGEDIDLRKLTGKIIDAALSFKDVISAGLACDPTGHAASAWAVVSLGLTMAQNDSDRRDALLTSSEYLAEVLARCIYIEENFFHHQTSNREIVRSATIKIYKAILQYAAEMLGAQNLGLGKRMLDNVTAMTYKRLAQHQSSIEKEEMKLNQYVGWDRQLQNEKNAEEILTAIDDKLSKSLSSLTLRFNLPTAEGAFYNSYKDQYESFCLKDTRAQLLDQIALWAQTSKSECIFWLNGMAGTGKSTIARTVAQSFEESGQLGASFFFKKGEADRGTAKRFIPTIVKQLIAHNHKLAQAVLQVIDEDPDISAKALREQFKKLLLQPLQSLRLNSIKTMVIVIDALDECENAEEISVILEHLPQTLDSAGIRLKIFLTSRPENPILIWFKRHKAHQDLVLHEISDEVIEHDIFLFLRDRFARIRNSERLPEGWPGEKEIQTLVKMSVPLFISAATVCRFIENERLDPVARLTELLENQARYVTQMDKTYLPILTRLLDGQDVNEKWSLMQQFQQIVGVIILLALPVSVNTLSKLLNIGDRTICVHLKWFHSVLSIPSDQDLPVRILHLSFRDFLLATPNDFQVKEGKTHAQITKNCLDVMRSNLKRDICNLEDYGTQRADIDSQKIKVCLQQELQYSCRYWVYHLTRGTELNTKEVSGGHILEFLQRHFLHWLEAMSLMGLTSETVEMVGTLQSIEQNTPDSELSQFLFDAKRFVLRNLHMTDTAPLQLYSSALIFSPTESIVRKHLDKERLEKVHILPQVERSWTAYLQTLEGHSDSVWSVAFSPDGQTVASGSSDKTIKLWDAKRGIELQTLEGHSGYVWSVAFSPDGQTVASGSSDKTIKLWDAKRGIELQTLEGHSGWVLSVAFSPDGQTVASGSHDKTIKLWDATTGIELQTLEGHSASVLSVAFSPDGQTVASGSDDKTIKLWDAKRGIELQTLEGHSDYVRSVAFSPDGQTVASGSSDKTIRLWDAKRGIELQTLEGHSGWVFSVAFSPDGQTVASGSDDKTIKLWDAKRGIELQTLEGHSDYVRSVAFSPDGQTVTSGSHDKTIKLWDAKTGKKLQALEGHSGWVFSVAFSPDGQTVASGSSDKTIKLWDAKRGIELQTLEGHSDYVRSVAFSPDGQTVASGSHDKTIKLWDAKRGIELQTLEGHSGWVSSVAFSPDGQTVASVSHDKTIKLWDAKRGIELQTLEGHSDYVRSVAFSPDGQTVASGSHDKTIKLWDAKRGIELQTLEGHSGWVFSVAFSPDGQTVASGSDDKTIRLWDAKRGIELQTLEGHSDYVRFVAFSPDGQTVASGSSDKTIKLWDAKTGKKLQALESHSDLLKSVATQKLSKPDLHVTIENEWVAFRKKNLIWLPTEYRTFTCLAILNGALALGYADGRVVIVGFSTD